MPQVKLYEGGTVKQAGTTTARLKVADYTSSGLATGLETVGKTLGDVAERLEREQLKNAELQAKDADVQFSSLISDTLENPETGYRYRRGKAAVESYEPSLKELEKARSEVAKTLPQGPARDLFERAAEQRLISARTVFSQHFARERETWADDTSEARIKLAESDAGNAYETPEEAEKYIATAVGEIRSVGERKAWSPEVIASKTLETVSGIRREIAGRLADLQPELGEKYLSIHRKQLTPQDADRVEDAIRTRRVAELAEQRRLEREARQEQREAAAILGEEARDTVEMMERGNIVDPQSVEKLATRLEQVGKPVLATQLRTTSAAQGLISEARTWRPDQLQGWINENRAKVGNNASAEQHAQLEAAEKLLGEMKTALKEDPLSWAVKAGMAQVGSLDLLKPQTVQARIRTALAVAEKYGSPPTFLTDEETASYAAWLEKADARQKTAFAGGIAANFGRHGRDVLATLSKDDPVFAHAAALAGMGGGYATTAQRIFAGQEALQKNAVQIPGNEKFAQHGIGASLRFTPKTRGAILEAAKAIYASHAAQLKPGEVDLNTWGIALNRAAGAVYRRDGSRVGGFGEYRGLDLVLPTGVAPDEFGTLVSKISDADLKAAGPPPRYANGKPVAAADLRKGYLFDAGAGRYFVSLDRDGTQFLRGQRGPYILNMSGLVPRLRGRR